MLRRHFINVSHSKDTTSYEIYYRTSNGMMYDIQAVIDSLSPLTPSFTLLSNIHKEDNWWCLTFLEPVIHLGIDTEEMRIYPLFYGLYDNLKLINSNVLCVTDVKLPNSVTSIGEAFYYCKSLTSIAIPNNVTSIGNNAFQGCSSITNIIIPNGVTAIGRYAFYYCSSLNSITFEGTIEQWNNVTKGNNWNDGVPTTVVHCTDGDVEI